MKRLFPVLALTMTVILLNKPVYASERLFQVQSMDTMKFSRDQARSKLNSPDFDNEIDKQVKDIAETGATHVAIATPYDEEFLPFLIRWVKAARRHNVHVWFRGNFSGWENWFDYEKIDRETHTKKVKDFILQHPDLFEDGDIFVSCPECENGGPGDPRKTGNVGEYRAFLINEYQTVKAAFAKIGKSNVIANYYSMNGDVARLVMDKATTKALDGIVTVDHYVKTPEQLASDLKDFAERSGGNVVLGEFGAPIPDINGDMTETQQADWIQTAMELISQDEHVVGINYWVNTGGSTELWTNGTKRPGADTLSSFYSPYLMEGNITDKEGKGITNVLVSGPLRREFTEGSKYKTPLLTDGDVRFIKSGYVTVVTHFNMSNGKHQTYNIIMESQSNTWWAELLRRIRSWFGY